MEGPTPSQQRLLETIKEFIASHGMSPTLVELSEILGIKPPSVHEQITAMIQKGLLQRTSRKVRSLALVEKSSRVPRLVSVPILGLVTAGAPILALKNRIGEVLVEEHVVRGTCFALQVKGDSMIEADILEGDLVIVRQQPIAENGDIVVALLGDEATVKRLFISDSLIELRPANPSYRPIRIKQDDELRILGKVLAVRSISSTSNA
ncbi:MAG: transcriptional repressor LexA [Magnetococcales bacterium]|nr:transcriptional repressor LexA [Magnetococcales bacterium]